MAQSITLYSPLDPVALATKLKTVMKVNGKRTDWHVRGKGTQFDMSLTYMKPSQEGNEPKFNAVMESHGEGTLISGTLSQSKIAIPFWVYWFVGVGVFYLFALSLWFFDTPLLPRLLFLSFPTFMFFIGLRIAAHSRKQVREDPGTPQNILDFLAETVDARTL